MSRKREKRIAQLNQEYEDTVAKKAVEQSYESIESNTLFTIDRAGSEKTKKRVAKELLPKATKSYISPTEQQIIKKYITKGLPSQVKGAYGSKIVEVSSSSSKSSNDVADIWDQPIEQQLNDKPSRKKLRVALPGQSYHPNPKDHQNIVEEAAAIEMKLKEVSNASKPVNGSEPAGALIPSEYSVNNFYLQNQTAQDITNLFLNNANDNEDNEDESDDNDSESNSDNDEDGEEGAGEGKTSKKRKLPEKLTRAQINRKKALRLAEHERSRIKAQASVNKSIDQVRTYLKDLIKEEKAIEAQTNLKKQIKRRKLREIEGKKAVTLSQRKKLQKQSPSSDSSVMAVEDVEEEENEGKELKPHEVSSVPLSDELHSSLRKVTPKGIAVKDYMYEMIDNGYMNEKRKKGFTIKDHPYLPRKVKWIPKYKY